jgi:hypothetical protein
VVLLGAVTATFFTTTPAGAEDSGTVTATVTPSMPCITLSTSTADFPSKPFSTPAQQQVSLPPNISVSNCGGSSQSLLARGTNATTGTPTPWTLNDTGSGNVCDLGPNTFRVLNGLSETTSTGTTSLAAVFLSTSNKALGPPQNAGQTRSMGYNLHMPCTGSVGAGSPAQFQMVYTATF